ncbi:KINESIN-LIKE PROTEIN [Salix purpurea]|uniref:Kinesin-like protein n=1 Tax=Salix purpurea TaxID=77065 RepID=A0A9Q0PEY4_SALPP|nr:KINESIN-LIKE PROTEIN [Salix purpurea]
MKHFMLPRNPILREAAAHNEHSPNPSSHKMKPSPSPSRRNKSSKENAPPPDPNSITSDLKHFPSPASAKLKSPLPPRPPSSNPLKRKLIMESSPENSLSDSGVKVIVRMRPLKKADEEEGETIVQKMSNNSLAINGQTFTFDSVADTGATQLDMFELVGAPLVENCLAGFNSSVFAYGQTGSGKTFTMWGPANALSSENLSGDQQGLTPRVFQRLFDRINEEQIKYTDKQLKYQCRCSFLEIYNEQITDLLDPSQRNLQIREDMQTGVYVENLREEYVFTMKDVTQLLIKGLSNRRTGSTSINAESSRSHSVFTCVVESRCKSMADGMSSLKTSRINLVDLAGSERQKLTGTAGERLKEAGNINRSLSQLGNLINILAEISQTGKQRHIPYRDSRLTFLLQESLGGNAKLAMMCAISPAQSCKSETFSTLRFAQRAKAIKNKAIVNEEVEDDVNHLREVIRQLRDELHRVKANSNNPTGWDPRKSLNILKSLIHPREPNSSQNETVNCVSPSSLSIVPSEVSLVLKSPTPSVSPRISISRKSLRTSSILTASQKDSKDESKPGPENMRISFAKSNSSAARTAQTSKSCLAPTEHLAASLHRGMEIIDSHHKSSVFRRLSFRFPSKPAGSNPILPVDVGVQTFPQHDEISERVFLCTNCKAKTQLEVKDVDDSSNLQLVPIDCSESIEKPKTQVPKAVEKVLAGAIRREMALEEFCAKQGHEIMQLNRLVQQYKHERECNSIIGQTREDKILRLESLMDGVLSTKDFMEEELAAFMHEHKLLKDKYENHPEVSKINIEMKRVQDELENYRNFCDLGEREVLLEEIQDLRSQLQYYTDSSSSSVLKRNSLLKLTYPCEP